MRAAFMTGRNQIEVREADEPALDPRGAILRVEACGICGTDARTFFNGDPRAPAPWVLGHEPVGHPGAGRARGRPAPRGRGRRAGVSRLDPHLRPVPPVHRRAPEPLRAPPAVRLRPVPRGLCRAGRRAPDRRHQPHPPPARPAARAGHGGRPLRLRPQRDRGPGHRPRRHRADPGGRPDRLLAGGHGPGPGGRPGVPVRRQPPAGRAGPRGGRRVRGRRLGRRRRQRPGRPAGADRRGPGPSGSAWPPPPSRPSRRPWRWRPSGPGSSTSPACPSTTR